MDKDYLVTKSNYFIMNSSYDLSLEEQKIILTLASMVQPEDETFKPYIFKIAEFMKLVGVEDKSKYTEIPKITKELMKKVFEIHEGNKIIQTAWLSGAIYEKGTGYVELIFSPYLKPYMLKLNTMFTQYKLTNILNMKSKYSPRIYELLKCNEFKKQGYIEVEMDELRKLLKCDGIYPLYADFKRFVIFQAQKEINEKTDISFDFEEIKSGRKVTSIKFYINKNTKASGEIAIGSEISAIVVEDSKDLDLIKQVQAIFTRNTITAKEAAAILKDSANHVDLIKQCYEYMLTKDKIDNVVGYMRKLVKGFNKPQENNKVDSFNDYPQRKYDFKDMEKKLLGWK